MNISKQIKSQPRSSEGGTSVTGLVLRRVMGALRAGVLLGVYTEGSGRVSRPKGHQIWERGDGFGRVGVGMRVECSRTGRWGAHGGLPQAPDFCL